VIRSAASLLEELRAVDESSTIEAKTASRIDRSVLETVCAFANEPRLGGGYLLLGVTSKEPSGLAPRGYDVVGVSDPDKLQADLATQCAGALNRAVRPHMVVESLEGKTVIVVWVLEAAAAEKPIYLTALGLPRGAFRRVGSTDQHGTEDDLIALYQGHDVETYDGTVVRDGDLSDLDPEAIRVYRELRKEANPVAEELTWADPEMLRALNAVVNENGTLRPTVAGLLLFGTAQALRRCFPMMRIDYVRIPGREWVSDPDHRFDTVEIRAPLLLAARRAIAAVRDDLPASFRLPEGETVRSDETVLPLRVLREAIVNAVMHRSYRIQGPTQILRYANRLEMRNPGHSLKAAEQLGEPGSENRNPRIAAVMHEVHLAETKGSGIRAMRELMVDHNLLPPTFESSREPDQFVARFLFHHFLGAADLAWLKQVTPEKLSDEEARALVFMRETGAIDNAAYRAVNRTDTLAASAHLRRLRDLGLLEMKGSGSRTYYVPSGHVQRLATHGADADLPKATSDLHKAEADLHKSGPDLPKASEQTEGAIPPGLAQRISEAGIRPRQDVVRGFIRELCGLRPFSAKEISEVLGSRDVRGLSRTHLGPMIEAGELVYTIPQMPKHPEQRYQVPPIDEATKS
jgi:ATP-dependent DNA helicase RecG